MLRQWRILNPPWTRKELDRAEREADRLLALFDAWGDEHGA